mgnify:CR=1 FL=1
MKKILVATDFSTNSKVGLRFAIQLASQQNIELTFIHSFYLIKPSSWSFEKFMEYEKNESFEIHKKLNEFVTTVYKETGITPSHFKCIVTKGVFAESCILEHAIEQQFDFICIGTRGAGKLTKVFGTTASNLINHSTIPVIVVPKNYRRGVVKKILYATDFSNLKNELTEVINFAKPLHSKVELVHCYKTTDQLETKTKIFDIVKRNTTYPIKLHLELMIRSELLISKIDTVIKKSKANLLVMFTEHNKSFLKKIIFSSQSEEYSFKAKIPLLVYKKRN